MARDRIVLPGLPRQDARVLIDRISALEDRLAAAERKPGRAGVISRDYSAKAGEFLNIEAPSGELITITLPESTARLRGERVTLAFRNSNEVRIVAVRGTVNSESFVTNDRPGTYEAIADGLGGWYVQVGVSDEGSGAGGGGGGGGSFTPTFDTPVDVALANAEGVSSDFARADHVHRDRIATGSEDGYLSRLVYANASSTAVGTTFAGETVVAAPASWATADDIPAGNWFHVWVQAAGGGGCSGAAVHSTTAAGSPGGGGGACNFGVFSRAELVAALPISFTCGLGGNGGTGPTTTTSSASVNGAVGGNVAFGTLLKAFGGGGGRGGNTASANRAGGGGGGQAGVGDGSDTGTTATAGGLPALAVAVGNTGFGGGGCNTTGAGLPGVWGGGAGGGAGTTSTAGGAGGQSMFAAGGGGASGGAATTGPTVQNGGDGGSSGGWSSGGGGAAGAGSTSGTGATGATGATGGVGPSPAGFVGGAGGGAGGTSTANANVARTGGQGGAGGFPGGGGGAGGTALVNGGATKTGGNGGKGGDAVIVITR